jgi:uncharacterized repeat protein (TIGR02543 family)
MKNGRTRRGIIAAALALSLVAGACFVYGETDAAFATSREFRETRTVQARDEASAGGAMLPVYDLTLDANGGWFETDPDVGLPDAPATTGAVSKQVVYTKKYGELQDPERSYYAFKGWYTKRVGGKAVTADTKLTKRAGVTVYAHWQYRLTVTENLAKRGTKPRPSRKLGKFMGVTIHNTAEPDEGHGAIWLADMLRGKWKTVSKSWHYGVDDEVITRSIPEREVAWHAGNSIGNGRTIAIEICENEDSDLYRATERAAALTAKILKAHGVKKAVSNKTVFQHNYWSAVDKDCPRQLRAGNPYTWKVFIARVNEHLEADDI